MATLNTSINIKKGDFSSLPPVLPIDSFTYTTGTLTIDNVSTNVVYISKIQVEGTFRTSYTIPKYLEVSGVSRLVVLNYNVSFSLGIIDTLAFEDAVLIKGESHSIKYFMFPIQIKNLYINAINLWRVVSGSSIHFVLPKNLDNLYLPENFNTLNVNTYLFSQNSGKEPKKYFDKYLKNKYVNYREGCFEYSNLYDNNDFIVNEHLTLSKCLVIKASIIGTLAFRGINARNLYIDCTDLSASSIFTECKSVENIVVSSTIGNLGNGLFYNCTNLKNIYILQSDTSLTYYSNNSFPSTVQNIYVPSSLVDEYKTNFSSYSAKIKPLPWEVTE